MSLSQSLLCNFYRSAQKSVFCNSIVSGRFFSVRVPVVESTATSSSRSISDQTMPHRKQKRRDSEQVWKLKHEEVFTSSQRPASPLVDEVTNGVSELSIAGKSAKGSGGVPSIQCGSVAVPKPVEHVAKAVWRPKSYGTASEGVIPTAHGKTVTVPDSSIKSNGEKKHEIVHSTSALSKLISEFSVDKSTHCLAQIRATFYPKFENEKSDQEVRTRMIELVSKGLATLEVSLKHSGSLFMYAGHEGGAYAKNSYGNIYTAVGVFVLGRTFREAWGVEAGKMQTEFNDYLEKNRMCISMELVTAVLGDHGQRPREDYVVVTAVTELGNGKPKFYSTPDIIAFCRRWRLPTNHVWLFSSRKSVTSFFAAFDALCEEGTASTVCNALDDVADISVPGSQDHIKVQGEILEGLVARIVHSESSKHMEKVLADFPAPQIDGAKINLGASLREICAANRSDEKQQVKALLQSVGPSFVPDQSDWFGIEGHSQPKNADRSVASKFLQAHPADYTTSKLQEMIRLMRERHFPAAFKCYPNYHKINMTSKDNIFHKMVIHVHSDSAFRRYQKEMSRNPGLWPLYRGFFIDLNLFNTTEDRSAEVTKASDVQVENGSKKRDATADGIADEDANLMIKLKFLTYKLRTFLIRNGLQILFTKGLDAYKTYYLRQMHIWNTSGKKQRELSKMLNEWAIHILGKYKNTKLSSSIYLSEAEPFLEQYAKRSPENMALIGSAGNFVKAEDFMAIVEEGQDEEGDLVKEQEQAPMSPTNVVKDTIPKREGLIVFFPGIPGCAKSALCREILKASGDLGDDLPVHSLMGDLIKGKYWQKVAEECRKRPYSVMLADKNAPNIEVWDQIQNISRSTGATAVPVVPQSEGTDSNPFSLDALAVFIFRVLHRENHPGNLDKASPNAGFVLLMFYHLYDGMNRKEFENALLSSFGALVNMPLLKPDRSPLPNELESILEEGINLYNLHRSRHGRLESTKGTYVKEWAKWEKRLRETLFAHTDYLTSIQVPFEIAVKQVLEQLKAILKHEYKTPGSDKRPGTTIFSAISLPVGDILNLLQTVALENPDVEGFLKDKRFEESLKRAHVTLAHKRSHGLAAVCSYAQFVNREVPVEITALLFSDKLAALEAHIGSVDGERIKSLNEWPHITLWTAQGVPPKEANTLPQLHSEGKATRIEISPPITISGPLEFH
uniref:tRNA ligase phosphodiesterase domain-containing protein n=1 Tax=Kalanchoe fedtschenkoi TaxID=63787 RepID=A0A7N1A6Z7_KALFE